MEKKRLRHYLKKLRPINPWYLLVLSLIFGAISVYSMRQNNLKMIILRDKVAQADKSDGDIESALRDLRKFIYAHMNTNLDSGANSIKPPIQLKYRYDRLVQAQRNRIEADKIAVKLAAQSSCQNLPGETIAAGPRIPCIQAYIANHRPNESVVDSSLYKYDFVSPSWSPDLAGWSLLLSVIAMVAFLIRYGLERWLKAELKG